MKRILTAAATAAILLGTTFPALADDHHNGGRHANGSHHAPPPRREEAHRFHQGQVWRGHHMAYRDGHWGYYQPQRGVHVFVNIPI